MSVQPAAGAVLDREVVEKKPVDLHDALQDQVGVTIY